jgi:hypothetical protein
MRIVFYNSETANKIPCVHFINLDRVDYFTFSEKDGITLLYAIIGDDVHKLNEEKKINNINLLISQLQNLADKSRVDIKSLIDDCNSISKSEKRRK